MSTYLQLHKPKRSQYRAPRRSRPTGLTVIHTAESVMDAVGPDTGAEQVAAFIAGRSDPGSYHDLVDADSALQLVPYTAEAYQDGTGSNPYALSISFACRTTDWTRMTPQKRAGFLRMGALAFARQQAWLKANGHKTTPLRRISRAESAGGVAGFIPHGDRDPDRRTDPGKHFPWAEFFAACQAATANPNEEDVMASIDEVRAVVRAEIERIGPGPTATAVWGYGMEDMDGLVRPAGVMLRNARKHATQGLMQDQLLRTELREAVREVAAARGLDPEALTTDLLDALAKRLED
jgi:hypothetical protein